MFLSIYSSIFCFPKSNDGLCLFNISFSVLHVLSVSSGCWFHRNLLAVTLSPRGLLHGVCCTIPATDLSWHALSPLGWRLVASLSSKLIPLDLGGEGCGLVLIRTGLVLKRTGLVPKITSGSGRTRYTSGHLAISCSNISLVRALGCSMYYVHARTWSELSCDITKIWWCHHIVYTIGSKKKKIACFVVFKAS